MLRKHPMRAFERKSWFRAEVAGKASFGGKQVKGSLLRRAVSKSARPESRAKRAVRAPVGSTGRGTRDLSYGQ